MHILSKGTLKQYWIHNPSSKNVLQAWYKAVNTVDRETPNDLIRQFPKASIIPNSRVVFRLNRNEYRLVAIVDYIFKKVFIRFIGTHAQYDKIDATTI